MKIKYLKFVAILIFSFSTYSQVTVSVQDLQYTNNGQPAIYPTNCGNIDLASSTSTSISFGINLSKPNCQVVGLSDLRVYTQKSSSDSRIERSWTQIQESFWSTSVPNTYLTTASFSINSSDFNATGGTLFVVFKSSGNVEYQTACSFTITKTPPPTFTLSPTTLSIPCGSVAPVTFSYSNVYSTPGVTYNYSYSGWTFVSQTPNSITLKPANANILPSNFSLVPIVNGVTQPYKVCTVTRAPFTTTSAITGSGVVCPGATTTFNLTDSSSFSNVTWSIPEFDVATILSSTNSSVTIQAITSGAFTIKAVVENACGQTQTINKTFNIGVPNVNPSNNTISGIYDNYAVNYSPFQIGVFPVENATSYIWTITGSSYPSSCTNRPKFSNGSATMTTYSNYATINIGSCVGNYVVSCRPANACGQSFDIQPKGFSVGSSNSENPCDNDPIPMGLVLKNPIKVSDEIVLNIHHSQLPCDTSNNLKIAKQLTKEEVENIEYTIDIYDFYGRKLLSRKEKSSQIKISDTNLSKGKYIINISNDLGNIKREILLVE